MRLMPWHDALPRGMEVHRLDFDLTRDDCDEWAVLTLAERERACRFVRRADRVRFAATRAAARRLLARCIGCGAAEVPLSPGVHGKPFVDAAGEMPLFNVSHSGGHALIVVADGREVAEVGIDIEHCRDDVDTEAILEMAFTAQESREVRDAQDPLRALYTRWVGKEALLKAVGVGVPEHLLCVGIHPQADGGLAVASDVPGWAAFSAIALPAPDGYAAALAWRARAPG
ncbi:4'-phosphopantetheinyl transferase family protein [Variovorax sp. GB1R11]|uniref:4'-phosphopantetheinyl transferase family protein n=1 Tax=Variovorax sp. GB1R11 TaxID=3443741 RepID=UPI003F44D996